MLPVIPQAPQFQGTQMPVNAKSNSPMIVGVALAIILSMACFLGANQITINGFAHTRTVVLIIGSLSTALSLGMIIKLVRECMSRKVAEVPVPNAPYVPHTHGDSCGLTPLHLAVVCGDVVECKNMLDSGEYDIDAKNCNGYTPLHLAVMNGHVSCAETLVQDGACMDIENSDGHTPVHLAVIHGHTIFVQLFIEKNRDIINVQDQFGNTLLHLAATFGRADIVLMLLGHHARLDCVAKNQATPLDCAVVNGHTIIAKIFIHYAAKNRIFMPSPIDLARQYGREETARYLESVLGGL